MNPRPLPPRRAQRVPTNPAPANPQAMLGYRAPQELVPRVSTPPPVEREPFAPGESKYDPAYCDLLLEHMEKGGSLEAFAGRVGVARSTVYRWMESHDDFAEAVEIGKAASLAWWEELLRRQAAGNVGNVMALVFAMQNRFPDLWKDRRNVRLEGPNGGPVKVQASQDPLDLSVLTDEEFSALYQIGEKLRGSRD